ncbi:MAG: glycosyltransferase family 2 protein, partial [Candidatus Sericytochromatia bacterium]|nr:glycosyltransferase family 2 protein [Candidatus Sericytochromatia bacterium]
MQKKINRKSKYSSLWNKEFIYSLINLIYYILYAFYIILFLVSFINLVSQPILKRTSKNNDDFISILIPARNEEDNIKIILNSIIFQEYKNYEIIVLDDDSKDQTENIVLDYSKKYQQIKLINGKSIPSKWLGKNWACHQLANEANGEYLLFLDADTVIESGLINSSLEFIKKNDLKLLSIFPQQIMSSFGEKLIVPLMNNILLSLLPLILIPLSKIDSLAAANGQFMLFQANNYKENNWHQQAKNKITEDITIIRMMKKQGFRCATLLGNNLIKCRMYKSLKEGINGFSKNIVLMLGDSLFF